VEELGKALASGDTRGASRLLAGRYVHTGRDLSRARGARLTPGAIAREAGTLQVAVRWARPEPSGAQLEGNAVFLLVKETDWALLDVLGDDPFAESPLVSLRDGASEDGVLESVTMDLDTVYDFQSRTRDTYHPTRIPQDLAFYQDSSGGRPVAVLGTHDRRLAVVARSPLARIRGLAAQTRFEYRSTVVPDPGTTYSLATREGTGVLFEVKELGKPDSAGQPTRVTLRYLLLGTPSTPER
jgi:hypothetical protein